MGCHQLTAVLLTALFWTQNCNSAGTGPSENPLAYRVIEECSLNTFVADLKNDAGLMTSRSAEHLEFRLLTNSTYFNLDQTSGILRTSGRVDRDTICPARDNCTLVADFIVKPLMYFRKVILLQPSTSFISKTLKPACGAYIVMNPQPFRLKNSF